MRRENAAGQYAADGTIKINVLRECFRQKNARNGESAILINFDLFI
jgi:hypothetical protein